MLNEVAYVSLLEGSRSPTTIYSVVNPLEKLGRKRPSLLQTGTHKLLTSIHVALADIKKKKRERESICSTWYILQIPGGHGYGQVSNLLQQQHKGFEDISRKEKQIK